MTVNWELVRFSLAHVVANPVEEEQNQGLQKVVVVLLLEVGADQWY